MIIIVAVVVIVIIIGYFISKSSGGTTTVTSKTSPKQINVSLKVKEEESPEKTPEETQDGTIKGTQDGTGNIFNIKNSANVPINLTPTVPSFPTPHSNPKIDTVVDTLLENPHEYGYHNKQDIKNVVEEEFKKISFFQKWNWKTNLISNSLKALKKLKVEQVKQKFQENNYTLNKDLDLDKLISTVIDKNKQLKNNTDEIYKHVIEEIEKTQINITSTTSIPKYGTPPSPTPPSPPTTTIPPLPTTPSPTDEPKNDNFMNLLYSRM